MGRGSQLRASQPGKPSSKLTVSLAVLGGARSRRALQGFLPENDPASAHLKTLLDSGRATLTIARVGSEPSGATLASLLGYGRKAHLALHLPLKGPFLGSDAERILKESVTKLLEGWVEELLTSARKNERKAKKAPGRVLDWKKDRRKKS